MKKKIGAILLAVLMTSSFAFAYLTSTKSKSNVFSVGINTTEIDEDYPEEDLKPGESIQKVVKVKNVESVPCYVRVLVKYSDDAYEKTTTLDLDEEHWQKNGEYYYYQGILEVGKETEPLFTTVTASKNFDDSEFDLYVYEESVQSEGYENAISAFEAIGGLHE